MPLSDEEQRLLEEMERSLYHNDADDVATVGGGRNRPNYTAIALGIVGGVVGLALLIVGGVMFKLPALGLVGFALMFVGALLAIAPPRRFSVDGVDTPSPGARKRPSFMDSLNDRWERRSDGDER